MIEDVKERVYNPKNKEEFLMLKEIITCTYEYVITKDLQK
jgi:hypothetical protein